MFPRSVQGLFTVRNLILWLEHGCQSWLFHFLSFPVSSYANSLTGQNQACLAAYGLCRKYQDVAASTIATCQQSGPNLVSKLKSLAQNKDLVNQVQAAITQLINKHLAGNDIIISKAGTAISCSELVDLTQDLTQALSDNPASLQIEKLAMRLVNATFSSCTQDEVASLAAANSAISDTEDQVDLEIASTQDSLQGHLCIYTEQGTVI